ncbi:hypothetical protein SPFM10_00250 [Salmonella phage SPFM10]|nr:hypothetical protein SPFM10_00250 [Salmonella phage SPFM10]
MAGERALKVDEFLDRPRWQILLMLDNIRHDIWYATYLREEVGENYRMSNTGDHQVGLSDFENPVYGSLFTYQEAHNELLEAYDRTLALIITTLKMDTTSLFKQRSTRPILAGSIRRYWLDQEDVPSEQNHLTGQGFFRALSSGVRDSETLPGVR